MGTPGRSARAPWWRQAATLVSVVGLLVTLVFNTLAVRQGAEQSGEARETAQMGLLTQLNSDAIDAEHALTASEAADGQCRPVRTLPDDEEAIVLAALDDYDYLAWLFNRRRVTVSGSRGYFSARMIAGWRLARHYFGGDWLSDRYAELTRFVRSTPRADRPASVCAAA